MATFLLKSEPTVYSYADLAREGRAVWDGVANNTALIHLRSIKKGDRALMYHTGDERRIVGLAAAISDAYEDPKSPGLNAAGLPKLAVVDLRPLGAAKAALSLSDMKADARFKDFDLLRLPRLSVMPVPPEIDRLIRELCGLPTR